MARADRFPAGPAHRDFRRLAAALAASQIGDWLYNVALLTVVYERTKSPTWVALPTAARVAPIVLLGPLGGVVADRFDRRRVMIVSDAVRMAMMAALALVAAASLSVVVAPLIAAVATAAGSPYPPAVGATIPRLVAEERLPAANALRSAIGAAGIVIGPALGAGLLLVASPSVAILPNAGTFAVSGLFVASIPASDAFAPARAGASAGVLADLLDGAAALRRSRPVVLLVGAGIAASRVRRADGAARPACPTSGGRRIRPSDGGDRGRGVARPRRRRPSRGCAPVERRPRRRPARRRRLDGAPGRDPEPARRHGRGRGLRRRLDRRRGPLRDRHAAPPRRRGARARLRPRAAGCARRDRRRLAARRPAPGAARSRRGARRLRRRRRAVRRRRGRRER